MKRLLLFLVVFMSITLSSCEFFQKHFISNKDYRARVEKRFAEQRELASAREKELFSIFEQELNKEEEGALKFLFAYMPLSDLADYEGAFFLKHVRTSLEIRDFFPWGNKVPEDLFRHFVLPARVNNESLDSSRWIFFEELKPRLSGLSMEEAALEVNHWCHEKVNYRGTDGRTSSPLNTVKTAFGRCGEESTFTVAAMRSVGIPARQCYTPRWAHTDDNHAWVEVWVDGKWKFLGACEPEPRLNMGWFAGPSLRTMLVSTNVYGEYFGPEEALMRTRYFTRINLLPNYTSTKEIFVRVTDASGKALAGSKVDFCLYNYAEFYPLHSVITGPDGLARFTTGLGDLMIWAGKDQFMAFQKFDVRTTDSLIIALNQKKFSGSFSFDLIPPVEQNPKIEVSEIEKKENSRRLTLEDSIRNTYVDGFPDSTISIGLASEWNLEPDAFVRLIRNSRGNHQDIIRLFREAKPDNRKFMLLFLQSITEKDLHDASFECLKEHFLLGLRNAKPEGLGDEDYFRYVISPRIGLEYLRPFREEILAGAVPNPNPANGGNTKELIQWIRKNIQISDSANSYRSPISPGGVLALRVSDQPSRDAFFVAVCRTHGLPARLETATRKPQFLFDKEWQTVAFEPNAPFRPKGRITLLNQVMKAGTIPVYSSHFALSNRNGQNFQTLDYEGDPIFNSFPAKLEADAGEWLMITGNRLTNGSVLADLLFFDLGQGEQKELSLTLREPKNGFAPIGKLGSEFRFVLQKTETVLSTWLNGKPAVLFWPEPGKEPTRHVLAEIEPLQKDLEKEGARFLIFLNEQAIPAFTQSSLPHLPKASAITADSHALADQLARACGKPTGGPRPLVAFIRPDGEIWFFQAGYSIGTGQELLRLFRQSGSLSK